jgi:4-hydroxy-tetrahydrodipicolinate synthase
MKRPYQGIIPPIVTPLTAEHRLDVEGLERQLERIITGGVAGVFACGTTGEAPSLSLELRRDVVRETCRLAAGRVPVLVGIADTCVDHSLALAEAAASHGAQAVVLTAPYYFVPSQAELEALARVIARESPLPVFLYNIPCYTKAGFELDTVRRLTDVPRIIGMKDSSGDLDYFRALCELTRVRPDWTVLVGSDHLLAAGVAAGGHGGVTGGALIWPRLFVDLCEAALAGDEARVAALQPQVLTLGKLYRVSAHSAAVLKAVKCALALLGVCNERPAPPLHGFDEPERAQVRDVLVECGLLPPSRS